MKSTNTGSSKEVAKILIKIGAVLFSTKKPFRYDSGILSPIYVDNRLIISYPKYREEVAKQLVRITKENFKNTDLIAGVVTAGIPHAAWVSQALKVPMVYVRAKPKDHGRLNQIEGYIKKGQRAVIVEDLISTGNSSIKVAKELRRVGVKPLGVIAIYNYQLKDSKDNFKKAKLKLFNITNTKEITQTAMDLGYLTQDQVDSIQKWSQNPKNWKVEKTNYCIGV